MWYFDSPIGEIEICAERNSNKFNLIIHGDSVGQYNSAIAAADDVALFVTGYDEWDSLAGQFDAPSDIYEWAYFPD